MQNTHLLRPRHVLLPVARSTLRAGLAFGVARVQEVALRRQRTPRRPHGRVLRDGAVHAHGADLRDHGDGSPNTIRGVRGHDSVHRWLLSSVVIGWCRWTAHAPAAARREGARRAPVAAHGPRARREGPCEARLTAEQPRLGSRPPRRALAAARLPRPSVEGAFLAGRARLRLGEGVAPRGAIGAHEYSFPVATRRAGPFAGVA